MRRATQAEALKIPALCISIHALLAESDPKDQRPACRQYQFLSTLSLRRATGIKPILGKINTNFYPRSPCGERPTTIITICIASKFLSTLSLRRATAVHNAKIDKHDDFYPRSPCGERRRNGQNIKRRHNISIHALLAESDQTAYFFCAGGIISIHALLAESDPSSTVIVIFRKNFYPRSPCGERRGSPRGITSSRAISIHALLAESDNLQPGYLTLIHYFYPRSPCGERHMIHPRLCNARPDFYPRSPCGERHRDVANSER